MNGQPESQSGRSERNEALPSAGQMTLFEHLGELRNRVLYCGLSLAALSVVAYFFADFIFSLLTAPYYDAFGESPLIGTGPAEAFVLKLKVSVFGGLILSAPFLFHQFWLFVRPGLYPSERRIIVPLVGITTLLFLLGVWFSYAVVLPFAFAFFHEQYLSIGITPAVRLSEHLSTTISAVLSFGVVFETPVLAFLLARFGLIDDRTLISCWRHAVVIIFILAAVLTPPDVLTQFLLAGPLLLLYGISIVIARLAARKSEDDPDRSRATRFSWH